MARRFANVSEEEIKTAFFYPSDLANTKTTIYLRVGEQLWIYTPLFTSPSGYTILTMELCRKFGLDVDQAIDQLLECKKSQMKQVLGWEPQQLL